MNNKKNIIYILVGLGLLISFVTASMAGQYAVDKIESLIFSEETVESKVSENYVYSNYSIEEWEELDDNIKIKAVEKMNANFEETNLSEYENKYNEDINLQFLKLRVSVDKIDEYIQKIDEDKNLSIASINNNVLMNYIKNFTSSDWEKMTENEKKSLLNFVIYYLFSIMDTPSADTFIELYELFTPSELVVYIDEYVEKNEIESFPEVLGKVIGERTNPNLERID